MMALHARELIWRATSAVSRQLQVCAWPSHGYPSTHALCVTPVRSLYISSHAYGMRQPGSGNGVGSKGVQVVNRGTVEKVRIKFPAATNPSNRLHPFGTQPFRGGKKSLDQSLKASAEGGSKNIGTTSKNKPAGANGLQHHDPATSIHSQPYRKYIIKAKKMSAARSKRKEKSLRLTEPVSQLSKDINRWFNEVMEHLAKAESSSPTSPAEKVSTASGKQRTLTKDNHTSTTKECLHSEKAKAPDKTRNYNENIPPVRQENILTHKTVNLESGKGKLTESVIGNSQISGSSKTFWKQNSTNGICQGSAQNKNMTNFSVMDRNESYPVYSAQLSRYDNGALGKGRTDMLEIKPYSVMSSGKNESSLATAAGWLPYGSSSDTLSGNRIGKTKGRASQAAPVVKSAGSASLASEILSDSSRHELVSNAIFSGSSKTDSSAVSKQNAWETGKGFILLNNKDKAQEALERQEWLKKNQNTKPSSDAKNTGFILVDSDKPHTSSSGMKGSKNFVLSDNPHVAAAKRAEAMSNKATPSEINTSPVIQNLNIGNSNHKNPKRDAAIANKNKLFEYEKRTEAGKHDVTTASSLTDPEIERWVDLVQRKLYEIQRTKMSSLQHKENNRQHIQKGKAADHVSKKELASPKQIRAQTKDKHKIEMRPELPQKPTVVPDTVKAPTMPATKTPDLGTRKGSVPNPKPTENPDAEYERRFGQFINSSMGYEESISSSKIPKLFGPLTREEHELLETAKKAGFQKYISENLNAYNMQSKNQSKPVSIIELKPEMKSRGSVSKEEKFSNKKAEPTLFVKPEEIAPVKKLSRTALIETLGQPKDNISQGKKAAKLKKERKNTVDLTILKEEVRGKNKSSQVIQLSSNKSKNTDMEPHTQLLSNPQEAISNQKFHKETEKYQPAKPQADVSYKGIYSQRNNSNEMRRFPYLLGSSHLDPDVPTMFFQNEFLKLQQEKLDKSQIAKTASDTTSQLSKDKDVNIEEKTSSPRPVKGEEQKQLTNMTSPAKPKTSFVVVQSPPEEFIAATPKAKTNNQTDFGSKRKTQLDNVSSKELDPFEAWIQSMEDWKPETKYNNRSSKTELNASGTTRDSREPTHLKSKENKKYPRFVEKVKPNEMIRNSRDKQATLSTIGDRDGSSRCAGDAERCPERIPLNVKLNTASQSDQLYNMIIQESSKHASNFAPHGFITSPARKSKVLTQAGMGAVINSKTGIADPAKMPKLGNLFSSFDGFIAMEATPVVVEKAESNNTKSTTQTAKTVADDASDKGLRASLAEEREKASIAARKRLIEEYEKSIKQYERSLELYRSRLRRVRHSMADHRYGQRSKGAPKSDNPRRHSNF